MPALSTDGHNTKRFTLYRAQNLFSTAQVGTHHGSDVRVKQIPVLQQEEHVNVPTHDFVALMMYDVENDACTLYTITKPYHTM